MYNSAMEFTPLTSSFKWKAQFCCKSTSICSCRLCSSLLTKQNFSSNLSLSTSTLLKFSPMLLYSILILSTTSQSFSLPHRLLTLYPSFTNLTTSKANQENTKAKFSLKLLNNVSWRWWLYLRKAISTQLFQFDFNIFCISHFILHFILY